MKTVRNEPARRALRKDSIINILTLRYDPSGRPPIRKLTWRDFVPVKTNNPIKSLNALIKKEILTSYSAYKPKKITLALSSGIDSAFILATLREVLPEAPVQCISVSFGDSMDETKGASEIARICNADLKIVRIENPLRELPMQLSIVREPRWNLYWYYVVQEASSLSNLIFTGDGGDELFGGYTFRYRKFLESRNSRGSWEEKAWLYLNCHERDWVPDQEAIFSDAVKFNWKNVITMLQPYFDNPLKPLAQVFLADFNGKLLFDWIPTNRKFYAYFKIHGIAPLLSKEIVDFATHLPSNVKYNMQSHKGKLILRKILQKREMYDKISKEKIGFGLDIVELWNRFAERIAKDILTDCRVAKYGLIDNEWIMTTLAKLKEIKDVRYINKMLGLIAVETWYRIFVTKEMNKNTKL